MDYTPEPYIADSKPLVSPVVVPRSLFLAIGDMMRYANSGRRAHALAMLNALYASSEMAPLMRQLEIDLND